MQTAVGKADKTALDLWRPGSFDFQPPRLVGRLFVDHQVPPSIEILVGRPRRGRTADYYKNRYRRKNTHYRILSRFPRSGRDGRVYTIDQPPSPGKEPPSHVSSPHFVVRLPDHSIARAGHL